MKFIFDWVTDEKCSATIVRGKKKTNEKITPMVSVYLRTTNITVLVVYVVYCQCSECIVSEERSIDRWSSSASSSILPGNISSLAGTLLSIAYPRTYLVANEIPKKYTLHPQPHKDLWTLSLLFMMVPFCTVYTYCGVVVSITEPPVQYSTDRWSVCGKRILN